MKFLKSFSTALLNILLFFIISILTLTIITKEVIQKELIGSLVKSMLISEAMNNDELKEKNEILEKIDNKEINDILNNLMNDYTKNSDEEGHKVSKETVDSIINYFINHEKELEELTNEDIDINEITSEESRKELEEELNKSMDELDNNFNTNVNIKDYLKMYNFFTSNLFKLTLVGFIIIILILLILITKQKDIVLSTIGASLSINGTIILLGYLGIFYVLSKLSFEKEVSVLFDTVDLKLVMIIGLIELILGIGLFILKAVLKRIATSKKDKIN